MAEVVLPFFLFSFSAGEKLLQSACQNDPVLFAFFFLVIQAALVLNAKAKGTLSTQSYHSCNSSPWHAGFTLHLPSCEGRLHNAQSSNSKDKDTLWHRAYASADLTTRPERLQFRKVTAEDDGAGRGARSRARAVGIQTDWKRRENKLRGSGGGRINKTVLSASPRPAGSIK